ncbi:ATP-binding cassette domain-containing protein [candidate division KSB1 bacterium]
MPDRFYAFKEGSIIRGQRISPIYYTDIATLFKNEEIADSFLFSGIDIAFKFKNSDNGIHRFSFSEPSGQLIAVMGGSGVGKSTLLNILNGNIPLQHGGIYLNQFNIQQNKNKFEGLIGFVPQDDLLFENLSVWENLYYNARLCFSDLTKDEINEKVDKILRELELYSFKDLKVGSPLKKFISGGQRKRLNVALELIREPAIMFVDEPTSGLSSTDSEKLILLLKQQARKGKLIIVNIHQPSSAIFKLLDKLWILDTGGRPIYTGNPLDAIMYFKKEVNHVNADVCECISCGNVNPEQVLEIVETKSIDSSGNFTNQRRFTPQYWYQLYKDRIENPLLKQVVQSDHHPKSATKKPSKLVQFKIFFERNFRVKITDKQYLIINLIEAPILAIIVAYFTRYTEGENYVFFENKSLISYLFMSIVVVLFMGMSVSAEEIIKDRKILQRESFLNLSRLSYLNSKILFLVLLSAFQTFSFVIIGNFILGIHGMNISFWLILFSVAVFSNMLGLNISSAFDSEVTIYILVPLLLIPQILLCGVIVKFDDFQDKLADKDAVPVIGELMASRWAFEAMAVEQYKSNKYMANFFEIEKKMAQSRYRSDLLTTELIGQIDLTTGWQKLHKPEAEIEHKLQIIQNEIKELDNEKVIPPFPEVELVTRKSFDLEIAEKAKHHLIQIQKYHDQQFHFLKKKKDQYIYKISKSKGSEYLYDQKLNHHNKALEVLVLNTEAKNYYRETANGIMQKIAPIYKDPDFHNGRAHFLASEKRVFRMRIDTLYFNLAIILLMCTILYIALYFDWLRKVIELFGENK